MAKPADLDLPWTRTRAASRLRELVICGVLGPLMDLHVFKAGRPGPRHPLEIRFGSPIVPRADERPSEVMERVRLFLAESGARTEREAETEHAHRRQPA